MTNIEVNPGVVRHLGKRPWRWVPEEGLGSPWFYDEFKGSMIQRSDSHDHLPMGPFHSLLGFQCFGFLDKHIFDKSLSPQELSKTYMHIYCAYN